MLSDLLREAFGSDLSNSQEALSSVSPEMLASLAEDSAAGTGGTQPAAGSGARRQWTAQRGFSVVGAAAVTATLAGLLLARGGGGRSLAHERTRNRAGGGGARAGARGARAGGGTGGGGDGAGRSGRRGTDTGTGGRSCGGRVEVDVEAVAPPPPIVAEAGAGGSRGARPLDRSVRGSAAGGEAVTRAAAMGAVVVAALLSGRAEAATPEAEKEARAHFQAGEAHFKAGAFDEALAEYQQGYDAKPLPGFLVNIAQCQRRLGDLKKARATYQKFVLVAPDSPLVPQVRSMIAEIDGLPRGTEAGRAPTRNRTYPCPRWRRRLPRPCSSPAAPTPAPAVSSEPPRHRWWLWGALGAVVVGGAVTAIALSTGGTTTIHDGSLATLRR